KTERYLKNEQALEDFTLEHATDEMKLVAGDTEVEGAALRTLAKKSLRYAAVLKQIEKKGDQRIVDALVKASGLTKNDLKDETATARALQKMQGYFQTYAPELQGIEFELKKDAEHGGYKIVCPTRYGGARKNTVIDFGFLDSPEYEELQR